MRTLGVVPMAPAHRVRNSDFVRVIFTPLAERHIDSLHEYIAMHAIVGSARTAMSVASSVLQRALHISAEGKRKRDDLIRLRL